MRRAWVVLAVASASTFLFVLDAGFLSVAFPAIEDEFDASVALADEKALSLRRSPYRTIETLAEYAAELIEAGDE